MISKLFMRTTAMINDKGNKFNILNNNYTFDKKNKIFWVNILWIARKT